MENQNMNQNIEFCELHLFTIYRMLSLQPDRTIDRFWIKMLSEVNVIHESKNINQILNCSQPLNQNIKLIV